MNDSIFTIAINFNSNRNFRSISSTNLSNIQFFNTFNNRNLKLLIGIFTNWFIVDVNRVTNLQFVGFTGCNYTVRCIINHFIGKLLDCLTNNLRNTSRDAITISVCVIKQQNVIYLIVFTSVFDDKSINFSIFKFCSRLNFNVNTRVEFNCREVVEYFKFCFFFKSIDNNQFIFINKRVAVLIFNLKLNEVPIFKGNAVNFSIRGTLNVNINVFVGVAVTNNATRNVLLYRSLDKVPSVNNGVPSITKNIWEYWVTCFRSIDSDKIAISASREIWSLAETTIILVQIATAKVVLEVLNKCSSSVLKQGRTINTRRGGVGIFVINQVANQRERRTHSSDCRGLVCWVIITVRTINRITIKCPTNNRRVLKTNFLLSNEIIGIQNHVVAQNISQTLGIGNVSILTTILSVITFEYGTICLIKVTIILQVICPLKYLRVKLCATTNRCQNNVGSTRFITNTFV